MLFTQPQYIIIPHMHIITVTISVKLKLIIHKPTLAMNNIISRAIKCQTVCSVMEYIVKCKNILYSRYPWQ